jgi:type VI protein secretion system component VasK
MVKHNYGGMETANLERWIGDFDHLCDGADLERGESRMNLAEAISVVVGGAAAALTVGGTYTWWVYRRGQDSGRAKAEREADQRAQADATEKTRTLEKQLAAIQAELDSLRPKRRRI